MAKTKSVDELQAEIDEVDARIGEHGSTIEKSRKAQRAHLKRKDELVTALNDRIRSGNDTLNLGDDRG